MAIDASPRNLRRLLVDLDITNREAARYCGVSEQSLYRWLAGDAPVPEMAVRMFTYQLYIQRGQNMIRITWAEPEETSA